MKIHTATVVVGQEPGQNKFLWGGMLKYEMKKSHDPQGILYQKTHFPNDLTASKCILIKSLEAKITPTC